MARIPVIMNERSKSAGPATCSNHGTTMNCPSLPCPGVPMPGAVIGTDALEADRRQRDKRIAEAVAEFERTTGRVCIVEATDRERQTMGSFGDLAGDTVKRIMGALERMERAERVLYLALAMSALALYRSGRR